MYNYFWSYIGSHHVCFSKQIFSSHYNTFISYDNVKPCKCFPLLFPTLWKFIHICRINHIAVFFFGLANKLRPSVCHPGMPLLAPGNLIVFFLLIVFLDRCRITFIRLLFHTFQLSSHFEHFFFFFALSENFLRTHMRPVLSIRISGEGLPCLLYMPRACICNFPGFICFPNIRLLTRVLFWFTS